MIRIGVTSPAEIAERRFLPSLERLDDVGFSGIAYHKNREKANVLAERFGGKLFDSLEALCADPETDAVYVPAVPAAHFPLARAALVQGKHVFMEKPFTVSLAETEELVTLARERGLALHENFTFLYHSQLKAIREMMTDGTIGKVHLLRISFGFPGRPAGDFRYNRDAGGGAFLDAGCYTIRLASELLGPSTKMTQAQLTDPASNTTAVQSAKASGGITADTGGSGVLMNDDGLCAQIAFGMEHAYRCALEIWGSEATLFAERIMTAPDDYPPVITLRYSGRTEERTLPADPSFANSIAHFVRCVSEDTLREKTYEEILTQARLMAAFRTASRN